jgi:hypothetical protein
VHGADNGLGTVTGGWGLQGLFGYELGLHARGGYGLTNIQTSLSDTVLSSNLNNLLRYKNILA